MNGIGAHSMSVFLLLAGASLGVAANGNGSISVVDSRKNARRPDRGTVSGRDMLGRYGMDKPRAEKRPPSRGYPPRNRFP